MMHGCVFECPRSYLYLFVYVCGEGIVQICPSSLILSGVARARHASLACVEL